MVSLIKKAFVFLLHPTTSRTNIILIFLVILFSIPLTVLFAQMHQQISQEAAVQDIPSVSSPSPAQPQNPTTFVYIEPFIIDGIENTAIPVDKNITLFLSSLTDDSSSSPKEKSVFKEFILPSKYETATNTFSSPKFSLDNVPNGKYQLLLKVDGSLKQLIGIKDITNSNKTLIIQSDEIKLFIGDTNNDNELNILDYAVILNCFESNTFNPICVNSDSADINYDGMVNDADYNLFLKNILVSRAEKE